MKVVSHDHIRVDPPIKPRRRFPERAHEGRGGSISIEQISPIVSPIDYVITRARELHPNRSRHGGIKRICLRYVNVF